MHIRTWKSLWHFLLNTTICNCYKIINNTSTRFHAKHHDHIIYRIFRFELIMQLFVQSKRLSSSKFVSRELKRKFETNDVNSTSKSIHEQCRKLKDVVKKCWVCSRVQRKMINSRKKRKTLAKLSINNLIKNKRRERVSRTRYECELCKLHLCKSKTCWNDHIQIRRECFVDV